MLHVLPTLQRGRALVHQIDVLAPPPSLATGTHRPVDAASRG
jgi:hypothetical protein